MARETDTEQPETPAIPAQPSSAPLQSAVEYGTPAGGVAQLSAAARQPAPRPPAPELLMDESVAPGSRVIGGFLFMALVVIGVLLVVQGRTSKTHTPTGAASHDGKNIAVLLTTTQYEDARWPARSSAPREVQEVAAALRDLYGFTVENIENPSADEMRKKLRGLAEQSYDASDQLLIMFSGHGDKDEILQKGWIIARDSKPDDRRSAYAYFELREDIDNIPCPHILLILDVGFGGTFDPSLSESQTRGLDKAATAEELMKRKRQYRSRLYVSSAEGSEPSPFARKLLEALRSGGGLDGILTWSELVGHLEKLDPEPRGGVFPKSLHTDPGGDFLFVRKPAR